MTPAPTRADALRRFAETALAATGLPIEPASADASFRSYWRVAAAERSYIVMDAPPDKENVEPWLDIGARLRRAGLHAPEVLAVDREQGFVLMEDLGTRTYLARARTTRPSMRSTRDALDALLRMQTHGRPGRPAGVRRNVHDDRARADARVVPAPPSRLTRSTATNGTSSSLRSAR